MIRRPISSKAWIVFGIVGIVALCGIYELLSWRQHRYNPNDTTIPGVSQLVEGLWTVCTPQQNDLKSVFGIEEDQDTGLWGKIRSTMLFQDACATYSRLLVGLFIGCVLSVLIGLAMGCYDWLAALLLPPVSFLAKVPGTAMLAVFFVVVGHGEMMFISMIGFGVLPTLTQAVYLSAKHDLHDEEINKAYTLGASNAEVVWNVVFQQILPKVLESVRLQIGPAMVYLIAAEMLVGQVGLGYQIRMQQRMLHMNIVYVYLIILGLSGLLMDHGMLVLRRKLCPWFSRWR